MTSRNFCNERGVILDYTIRYTPQQNGKAERMNRTLVERSRGMIEDSNIPKEFWGEAIYCATYVVSRSLTGSLPDVTPAEKWFRSKPNVKNLRVFGCLAYSHIPKEVCGGKLDSKAEKCIMLGYASTGYRLWNIEKQKVIISKDVQFDENKFWYRKKVGMITDNDENRNKKDEMRNVNQNNDAESKSSED